jgi:transposase
MHTNETLSNFIEFRARGYSLRKAAEQVGISYSTAWSWDHQYRAEIEEVRAYHMETLKERLLPDCAELLVSLTRELKRVNAELDKRDYSKEPTWILVNRQNMILSRIDKVCANPLLPLVRPQPPQMNGKPDQNHTISNTDLLGGPPTHHVKQLLSPLKETHSLKPPSTAPEPNGKPNQNHIISNTPPGGASNSSIKMGSALSPSRALVEIAKRIARGERPSPAERAEALREQFIQPRSGSGVSPLTP